MAVVPTIGSGAAGTFGPLAVVAVWEWKNEFNCWIPYSGKVSCYIEQCMQAHQKGHRAALGNASSICLGQVDSRLAPYIIDIPNMVQFRQDTGTVRDVQKTLYPLNSAPGCGVYWEWMTDEGSWTAYEMAVSDFLEKCLAARQQVADLGCLGYNYNIDLNYLVQTNKISGFQRKIHRCVDTPYPVIPTAGPVHKAATCSCQQCLVSGGVGPIPSRFRHSMSNQLNSFTSHSSSQSPPAASSVPYPKPSLSGTKARFSTNSPWPPSALPPVAGTVPSNGFSSLSLSLQLQRQNKVNQALAGMTSILLSAAGLPSRLSHAPPSASTATKTRSSVKKLRKMPKKDAISDPEQIMKKYLDKMDSPPDEDCIICMEKLTAASGYGDMTQSKTIQPEMVGKLKKCSHAFHMLCLLAMYNNGNKDGSLQCPSCKAIYGEKTGTQPNGKMDVYSLPHSLPGHPDCGTIQIAYTILPGTQGPEHPNPGKPYTARGFPRYCFLPDNRKGRKVLDLLRLAWKRRLIFTVGVSSTTGEVDTVVWNEIHHKTEMGSNKSGHGFPDPNYLDNVLAELAAQGVSEDCLGH